MTTSAASITSDGSEGVADGEVEGEGVLEGGEVVVAGFAGVVGGMEADAEVGAEHQHGDVEAQSEAGAEGYVLEEGRCLELAAGTQRVFLQQPYVTGIEKQGAMHGADDGEAVFDVEFKLEGTGLIEVSVAD